MIGHRGLPLTLLLSLLLLFSPFLALRFFYISVAFQSIEQAVLGINSLLFFSFAIATWKWKKWGVYGLIGDLVILTFVSSLKYGGEFFLIGLVAPGFLIVLVKPIWNLFVGDQ